MGTQKLNVPFTHCVTLRREVYHFNFDLSAVHMHLYLDISVVYCGLLFYYKHFFKILLRENATLHFLRWHITIQTCLSTR